MQVFVWLGHLVEVIVPFVIIHCHRFLKEVCHIATDSNAGQQKKKRIRIELTIEFKGSWPHLNTSVTQTQKGP